MQWAHGYGKLSIKAPSRLLDTVVQSSCTLSPGKRWDYPWCIALARPLTGNPSGMTTGPETQLSSYSAKDSNFPCPEL